MNTLSEWVSGSLADAAMMTGWEAVAVVLAIAYLLLAMRQSLWCWPAAAGSTLIYIALFWHVSLLMESLLSLFYLIMAGVGFYQWRNGGPQGASRPLVRWSWQRHLMVIVPTAVVALAVGHWMAQNTSADLAYLDALTTCFAIVTTWMLTIKVVENWLYWVVIDLLSIYLYLAKGLWLTSALYLVYVVLAVVGYLQWLRQVPTVVDDAQLSRV
ncbi:MAG: nicotinamide riboside transporter PnuC [Ferrimonas sp.]